MDVATDLGAADHPADILAIFDDRIASLQRLQRDLVADRNVGLGSQPEIGIVRRDDAQHLGSGGQVFDDDDADIVVVIVDKKLWNAQDPSPFVVM